MLTFIAGLLLLAAAIARIAMDIADDRREWRRGDR